MKRVDRNEKHTFLQEAAFLAARACSWKESLSCLIVTFLVVAILAATNVVSKYALKSYTEDQIKRINWDAVSYQTSDISEIAKLKKELSEIEAVSSVKDTGSMKLAMGSFSHLRVEGGSTKIAWFMMIASEDPNLLPPDLRPANGETVTALGGFQAMLGPYWGKISPGHAFDIFHEDPYQRGKQTKLFSAKIDRLSMPERLEIVKYFLDKFGPATFIPDHCCPVKSRTESTGCDLRPN